LEELPQVREFALRIAAQCAARVDVPKRNRHGGGDRAARRAPPLANHPFALSFGSLLHCSFAFRPEHLHPTCLRFADGRMPSACRYLATVRRAILICLARSISAIAWSESGLSGSSAVTSARIFSLTVSALTSSPVAAFTPEVKKNFSSKIPCGVCAYLLAVARLMVDSCIPMSSATSLSTSGFN